MDASGKCQPGRDPSRWTFRQTTFKCKRVAEGHREEQPQPPRAAVEHWEVVSYDDCPAYKQVIAVMRPISERDRRTSAPVYRVQGVWQAHDELLVAPLAGGVLRGRGGVASLALPDGLPSLPLERDAPDGVLQGEGEVVVAPQRADQGLRQRLLQTAPLPNPAHRK